MKTMIDGPVQDVPDPAAKAFEALREEVALARRAVAGLAAERASIEIPDYSATLGEIAKGHGRHGGDHSHAGVTAGVKSDRRAGSPNRSPPVQWNPDATTTRNWKAPASTSTG